MRLQVRPLFQVFGKRASGPMVGAVAAGHKHVQLVTQDNNSGLLVDTGAQVSVIPASWREKHSNRTGVSLTAANGT